MSDTPRALPRQLLGGLLFLLCIWIFSTVRGITEGERQLSATDAAIRQQDWKEASARARSAASWYVPGAPHVLAAYGRLLHIARTTEANNDKESAIFAWRAMRAAAEQTRWLIQPHAYELALANRAIARLSSDAPRPMLAPEESDQQADKRMQALLERRDEPRGVGVALVVVGLSMAAVGLFWLILRGVSPEGEWDWKQAKIPAIFGLLGMMLYTLALWIF